MFTDGPATPVRLEVLLDLLDRYPRGLTRETIYELLQPTPLSGGTNVTTRDTIGAALQLGLATEEQGAVMLASEYDRKRGSRWNILRAADERVLGSVEVEYHLALFYAYYLGLGKTVYARSDWNGEQWAARFNGDVFGEEPTENKFNSTKYAGLNRWMSYLGLGWHDPSDLFQAVPYERLLRALPTVFKGNSKMEGDSFFARLGEVCPEVDGGLLFKHSNGHRGSSTQAKECSLGLSHALLELHEDRVIRLDCPVDSRGWSIACAEPSRDDAIRSDRVTQVEYLRK